MHEYAHNDFNLLPVKFSPTKGTVSENPEEEKNIIAAMNNYIIPYGSKSDVFVKNARGNIVDNAANISSSSLYLNEAFSDSYGAMVYLKESNFSEEAINLVKSEMALRQFEIDVTREDVKTVPFHQHEEETSYFDHSGALETLRQTLDNINDWKDLSPEQMKQKAVEYASNTLVHELKNSSAHSPRQAKYFADMVGPPGFSPVVEPYTAFNSHFNTGGSSLPPIAQTSFTSSIHRTSLQYARDLVMELRNAPEYLRF